MVSSISNINPSTDSLYSGKHERAIHELLSSDKTIEAKLPHLAQLGKLANQNHHESIELLHNLALGKNDVAEKAANMLFRIQLQNQRVDHYAAHTIRSCAQDLIIKSETYKSRSSAEQRLIDPVRKHPKILLMAGATLAIDRHNTDAIPRLVRDNIQSFDQKQTKPTWWCDLNPVNGWFKSIDEGKLNAICNDKTLQHTVPNDGACHFRALFAITSKDPKWLNSEQTTKSHVLNEINRQELETIIMGVIKESIDTVKQLGFTLSPPLSCFFAGECAAETLYGHTISSRDFTLYSPTAFEHLMNEFNPDSPLSESDKQFLNTLANGISQRLNETLQLPTSVNDKQQPYLKHDGENHYNLVTPPNYFNELRGADVA